MSETESTRLELLAQRARNLADELFQFPACIQQPDQPSCLAQQEAKGRRRVAFCDYQPEMMCAACAAYWHVEMAAQQLWRRHCLAVKYGGQ
jgi:hypothetical protein